MKDGVQAWKRPEEGEDPASQAGWIKSGSRLFTGMKLFVQEK